MNISIQSKGGTPIYEQIATQIKEAILAGKLNKDDALPSIRALSASLPRKKHMRSWKRRK